MVQRMTEGKVAVVTGAGSGIGRAVSVTLHTTGYAVVLAGRRAEELRKTSELGIPDHESMVPVPTDISDPASVKALFETVHERFGRIDVLFNNAGINAPGVPMEDLSFEHWSAVVGVNLTGAFLCAQAAIKMMK